jgi:hypothetical protein
MKALRARLRHGSLTAPGFPAAVGLRDDRLRESGKARLADGALGRPPRGLCAQYVVCPSARGLERVRLIARRTSTTHAHTHARSHARMDSRMHVHTHACAHARTCARTCARSHERTDARERTHGGGDGARSDVIEHIVVGPR